MEAAAERLTSSSRLGSAVAIPPIGAAPLLRQTATRRRNMFARKSVVLMSTPNRSGHTESGSVMTNSKMLALKSHRAAFSPAAYGPSSYSISSIWKAAGSDSTSGIPRIVASSGRSRHSLEKSKKSRQKPASSADSILGR